MECKAVTLTAVITCSIFAAVFAITAAHAADTAVVGDLQINLITQPDPVEADRAVTIFVKLLRRSNLQPVTHATVTLTWKAAASDFLPVEPTLEEDAQTAILAEADDFGNYAIKHTFNKSGLHTAVITVSQQKSDKLEQPVTVMFNLPVEPAGDQWSGPLFLLVLIMFMTGILLYGCYWVLRSQANLRDQAFNLLEISWIMRLLKWRRFKLFFQIPLLIIMIVLILLAFGDVQDAGKNLTSILVWTIWWAGIIFTFVLVGRAWCFMCPVGRCPNGSPDGSNRSAACRPDCGTCGRPIYCLSS